MSSSGVSMKFKGMSAYIAGIEAQPQKIKVEAGNAIYESALRIAKDAVTRAPVDTGWLHDNIEASKVNALTARVDSFAEYSWYVENGTRKMDPEPFLQPAINMEAPRIYTILQHMVKEGLR